MFTVSKNMTQPVCQETIRLRKGTLPRARDFIRDYFANNRQLVSTYEADGCYHLVVNFTDSSQAVRFLNIAVQQGILEPFIQSGGKAQ